MALGNGSDSLHAVLVSAKTSSRHGSSATPWQSLKSLPQTDLMDPPGHFFPVKIAMTVGLVKLFLGALMLLFGGISLLMDASLSSLGAGLWVGVVVIVSGFLGACASKRPYALIYVMSFMSVSILSLVASGLLVVLSATAWARDAHLPEVIVYDRETQSEVNILGTVTITRPTVLVSGFLVVLGVFDVLLSLACIAMSARESCGIHAGQYDGTFGFDEGHGRKERLYKWLGQQKHAFQNNATSNKASSHFIPLSSSGTSSECTTRGKIIRYPTNQNRRQPQMQRRSRTPSNNNSSVILIHPQYPERYPNYPPVESNYVAEGPLSLQSMLPVNSPHVGGVFPHVHHQMRMPVEYRQYPGYATKRQMRLPRNHPRSKRRAEKHKKRLTKRRKPAKKKPLTDEQIEKTYTGLDREIAEGFISFAMEPAVSNRKCGTFSDNESF